jgi:1L-myo-inositol 1-phosphate cytidylyltransferase
MKKTSTAVILSAGKGFRLSSYQKKKTNKTLIKINKKTLMQQNIINIRKYLGIKKIYIVVGYNFKKLKKEILYFDSNIKFIHNKKWKNGNATSLIYACNRIKTSFYLMCGDHYFNKSFYNKLLNIKKNFFLVCSKKIDFFHDFEDVTKVFSKNDKLKDIGKKINKFNCYDTGFFKIEPKYLNLNYKFNSISEIIKNSKKIINLVYVKSKDWIDLDTKKDIQNFKKAIKNKIFTY